MKSFSKRYKVGSSTIIKLAKFCDITLSHPESREFLSANISNRLLFEIRFITKSAEFIEPFLLVDNQQDDLYYLAQKSLASLSEALIGYDITRRFELKTLKQEIYTVHKDDPETDDSSIFDLIELLIIFAKDEKREEVTSRFKEIFEDENYPVVIMDWMIVPTTDNGIASVAPLLKNKDIRDKLRTVYAYKQGFKSGLTPESAARASADLVQYIFSSDKGQSSTKLYSAKLINTVASNWTTKSKVPELEKMLNDLVLLAKNFNNGISNIRHTDKHTIQTNYPGVFDVIFSLNMSVAELVLTTAQNEFIEQVSPKELKSKYLKNYKIDSSQGWIVSKKKEDIVNLDDIPF